MDIYNYLKTYQPIAFSTFENCLRNDSFSHTYLFVGQAGTPLLETAEFIAKSILQNENNFYKYSESMEKKIENGGFSENYKVIDLRKTPSIKIENLRDLTTSFSTTRYTKQNKKIYIINLMENLSVKMATTLLKFLEEPPSNTYAFLTTENESKILNTIKSRAQIIKFHPLKREELIIEAEKIGISNFDAFVLSYFYSDISNFEKIIEEKYYKNAKNLVFSLISNLNNFDKEYLEIYNFVSKQNDEEIKETNKLVFDILILLFNQAIEYKMSKTSLLKIETFLLDNIIENINQVDKALLLLMNLKEELNYNINVKLLFTHLISELSKL